MEGIQKFSHYTHNPVLLNFEETLSKDSTTYYELRKNFEN